MFVAYVIAALIALWIGRLAGQQPQWATWHGPLGAALVMPIAMTLGFDPLVSVIAPSCLAGGFLVSRHSP